MLSQAAEPEPLPGGPNPNTGNPGIQSIIPAPALLGGAMLPEGTQQFCLRWNSYPATVATQLATLRAAEDFVDVTLACEGRQLRAHKLVLSACSPYFMQLFKSTPCQHPVIFLRDVGFRQLVALLEFMYAGEVNVSQVELPALLRTAEALQVRGLADTTANNNNNFPSQTTQKHIFTQQYTPADVASPPLITPPVSQQQQQQQHQQHQHMQHQQHQQQQQQQHQQQLSVPLEQSGGNERLTESTQVQTTPTPSSARRRRRKGNNVSETKSNPEMDDSSSESNDSQEEFGNGEGELKPYANHDPSAMEVQDSTEPFNETGNDVGSCGGVEAEGDGGTGSETQPQDSSQCELGSASFGGSQSEEETSEEEDEDDDDGEIKDDFTYQSDASFSQDTREVDGNPNGESENVAGPSSGESPSVGTPDLPGSKEEGAIAPDRLTGGPRNRLSRSLWPPGIPYHGPQQCPYCPRVLSNVGNWRKHVLTMHFAREKVYKCRHCNSSFRTAEYLQKHYVRVHSYPQKMTRRKYVEQT